MARTVAVAINFNEVGALSGSTRVARSSISTGIAEASFRESKLLSALGEMPDVGDDFGVYDHGIRIFGGTVSEIRKTPIAGVNASELVHTITAVSWEANLQKRIVYAAYDCETLQWYAGDLVNAILGGPAMGEVHIGTIALGIPPESLKVVIYRGENAWKIIQDLAERCNYVAWIDPDRNFNFVPRGWQHAALEVSEANTNYRKPEVRIDRTDYYNKVSLAISYDAFAPTVTTVAGDASYPSFRIVEGESNVEVPIDIIKTIKLNGVENTFSIKSSGQDTNFYYTPGTGLIEWNPLMPAPIIEDLIEVTFYAVGANVITVVDGNEVLARQNAEGGVGQSTGIYAAYMEDYDITDVEVGTKKAVEFLDRHCPARYMANKSPGDMPSEYVFEMWSDELRDFATDTKYVTDIQPGRVITYSPSGNLIEGDSVEVLIQTVNIEERPVDSIFDDIAFPDRDLQVGQFKYTIRAIDATRMSDETDFFRALAEVGGTSGRLKDFPQTALSEKVITLGFSGDIEVGQYADVSIPIPAGQVFRCKYADAEITTPGDGVDVTVDMSYSSDPPETAPGDRTWNPVFVSSAGDLIVTDGQMQPTLPLGKFSGFPLALDIPSRSIVRATIMQVGSTVAGADLKVLLVGDISKEGS